MRKMLVAATMLSLVGSMAFAGNPYQPRGWIGAGDANLAITGTTSNAGVSSTQGTGSHAMVNGNGAVLAGTVSGNYSNVQTGSQALAGTGGAQTDTYAQQVNVGGTVSGGFGANGQTSQHGFRQQTGATGGTGGGQSSQTSGDANATARNVNLGGLLAIQPTGQSSHRRGGGFVR